MAPGVLGVLRVTKGVLSRVAPLERTPTIMTEKNAEMARLLMAAEAVVEELDRQGLLEAVINLGFDPDQMAKAVIKAADRDVVPAKRSLPL
jgi:Holliday junction resolvasome RuvABC DNA-binding subunit